MTKDEMLDLIGQFTYCWGCHFFIETSQGNFIWLDPDYQGDNTLTPTSATYKEFCEYQRIPFGRGKGKHRIGDYCGEEVVFNG